MSHLFGYTTQDHFLLKVDARVKILSGLAALLMILSYNGSFFPVVVMSFCLLLCLTMKIPPRNFFLRFSEPLFIAIVLVFIKMLFSGEVRLWSFHFLGWEITCSKDGLLDGLMISARIMGAVSVVSVIGFSTPFTDLVAGLAWFRVPQGFIEILVFAYRYIFLLFEDAMVIYNAQKNRLGYSSMRRGLSSFGVLAGSLIIKAFDSSQNTTSAMVRRGYDGSMPMLKQKPFRISEVSVSILFVFIMGVLWKI
jgi:cobalt/nickel transport system permease protein